MVPTNGRISGLRAVALMPLPSEFQIHRAVVMWFRGVPGKLQPAGRPGVIMWHTPNNARREDTTDSALEGKLLKDMGLLAGTPDLYFLWGRLYGLELKKPGGSLSKAQRELHPRLIAAGAAVETADNLPKAKEIICGWGLTIL